MADSSHQPRNCRQIIFEISIRDTVSSVKGIIIKNAVNCILWLKLYPVIFEQDSKLIFRNKSMDTRYKII